MYDTVSLFSLERLKENEGNNMIKLVVALTFHLSTPATILTFDLNSYSDCLKLREEKVKVLDEMNAESIIIGYSAVCTK